MAVPGPVTSAASAGCHELIRARGAALVTDAADVLDLVGDLVTDARDLRRGCGAAARRAGPGHAAGARGAAGTPPGRCRQRRPGRRAGRADRAAARWACWPPAGWPRRGTGGGDAARRTGPGELTTRRAGEAAGSYDRDGRLGRCHAGRPARRCLRSAATTGHGVVRGRVGVAGAGARTSGDDRALPPAMADALARLRAAPALGARAVGALGPGLPRRRHHPARARPPDGPDRLADELDLLRAAQLAGRPGDPGDGPRHAGPAGGRRAQLHRLGGPRPACCRPTPAPCSRRPRSGRPLPGVLRQDEADALLRRRRAGGRRRRARPPSATWRCSRCSTPAASGSASCAGSTSTTSTATAGCCGSSARAPRSGWSRSGAPALRAVDALAGRRPPAAARADAAALRCSSARGAAGSTRARYARSVHDLLAARPRRPRPGPARPPPFGCHPPAGRGSRPEKRSGTSRSRYARNDADLHPCVRRPAEGYL